MLWPRENSCHSLPWLPVWPILRCTRSCSKCSLGFNMPFVFECFCFVLFWFWTASGKWPDYKNFLFHRCLVILLPESLGLWLSLPPLCSCLRHWTLHGRQRGWVPCWSLRIVIGITCFKTLKAWLMGWPKTPPMWTGCQMVHEVSRRLQIQM